MRHFNIVFIIFLICSVQFSFGQISRDIAPLSATDSSLQQSIESITPISLGSINTVELLEEDMETDGRKDIPWRFGFAIEVDIDVKRNGQRFTGPLGENIYILKIKSEGAVSLNLNFDRFYLPEGSFFHIYSPDRNQLMGAFSALNNHKDSLFSTSILRTNEIVLEYSEPKYVSPKGILKLSSVVHGYRELYEGIESFGASGSCNIDVNCPEGAAWQDDKRAVAMMLLSNNTRVCSGTLLNNAREDGTPYFLTANHCSVKSTNVFIFNYEVSTCRDGNEPPLTDAISGCTSLATGSSFFSSDFHLVRLSNPPPSTYNAFYAGWSKIDEPAAFSAGIHHPLGDVKKIALDYDPTVSSGYYIEGDDHWSVLKWDEGTTQDASSGSALFNHQHRVIGQLHGGEASCVVDSVDFYGKFSHSWEAGPDSNSQLKFWLDPDDIGLDVLDGYDPNQSRPTLDAQIVSLGLGNDINCSDSLYPTIIIRNGGSTMLNSLQLNYYIDGKLVGNHSWTGSLTSGSTDQIPIPAQAVKTGTHIFRAELSLPNGTNDNNPNNDYLAQHFFMVQQPTTVELEMKTDDFGNETRWKLTNATGKVFDSFNNYPGVNGGKTYNHQFCLYSGCYQYIIFDTFGDGFCCGSGQGSFLLTDVLSGDTIKFNNTFNSYSDTTFFCVGDSCTILVDATINPVSLNSTDDGSIEIDVYAGNPPFIFSWSNGASSKNISGLKIGMYTLEVTDSLGCVATFEFQIDQATGIVQFENQEAVSAIYPNPATNELRYKLNGIDQVGWIQIQNMKGQILIQQRSTINGEGVVDLKSLTSGIYIFKVLDNNSHPISIQKLMKVN